MPESSSESDDYQTDDGSNNRISNMIQSCLSEKPEFEKSKTSVKKMKSQLDKIKSSNKQKKSSRIDDRKQIDDFLKEISTDIFKLSQKIDTMVDIQKQTLDKVDSLESNVKDLQKDNESLLARVVALEANKSSHEHTFAEATATYRPNDDERISRLEYTSSEDERKKRCLEVNLTHPSIDNSTTDLEKHVREFFSDHMGMESRSIDRNMRVKKSKRANTVQINLSNIRFKKFLYAAKKQIRVNNPENHEDFLLNEYLTTYNFDILKKLKAEKKRCADEKMTCFETLYTFEGRVYIKKTRTNDKNDAICVNTRKVLDKIINDNKSSSVCIPETTSA